MDIAIDDLRRRVKALLMTSGADERDVDTMVEMRLEYDLRDNTFSGLEELEGIIDELRQSRDRAYTFDVEKPSMALINGNGRSARLIGMSIIDRLCGMAREQGIALIGVYNASYHGTLEIYTRRIAAQGLIGLVSANGGPQGVVPFGGKKDLFGTNPFSYAIPTVGSPIVFDAATAKYAYGSIRLARKHGRTLPEESYLDAAGEWTTDPAMATRIVPFGGHKGYAINLLLEVLTGALVHAKMGLAQEGESDLGSVFIAIDPAAFGPLDLFTEETGRLVSEIEEVQPAEGFDAVHVPGHRGEKHKRTALERGHLTIDDLIWREFEELYARHVR